MNKVWCCLTLYIGESRALEGRIQRETEAWPPFLMWYNVLVSIVAFFADRHGILSQTRASLASKLLLLIPTPAKAKKRESLRRFFQWGKLQEGLCVALQVGGLIDKSQDNYSHRTFLVKTSGVGYTLV